MRRQLTVKQLLKEAKQIRFADVPFYRELFLHLPSTIDVDPTWTAEEVLKELEEKRCTKYLNTKMTDMLVEDENKRIRCLIRWSFVFGMLGSFGTLIVLLYQFVTSGVQPDGWLVAILVGIPAGIMWTQAGVLKAENAMSVSKIIDAFKPGRRRSGMYDQPSYYQDESDMYPPQQRGRHYSEDNNGNPYEK